MHWIRRCAAFVLLPGLTLLVAACNGDVPSGPNRHVEDATEIVLLGTTHFAGSALDERSSEVPGLLSSARQQELDAVADRIADWGPDRFFVECMPSAQGTVDSLYQAYRAGSYDPTAAGDRNEIYQLGFRAAARADLEQTGCVDARGLWLGAQAQQVAKTHNPAVLDSLRRHGEAMMNNAAFLQDRTLGAFLRELNTNAMLWANHKAYNYYFARMGSFDGSGMKTRREGDLGGRTFAFGQGLGDAAAERARTTITEMNGQVAARVGPGADYVIVGDRATAAAEVDPVAGADTLSRRDFQDLVQQHSTTWMGFPDHHIGADLVGEWYKRNLRTYANIWQAVEARDERVILLIGQAHVWTLRQFFRENPDFEVIPVREVI